MTKRIGRPPKNALDRHTERLELVLTPAERELLEEVAGDKKLATWCRETLIRVAKRRKQ